MEKKNETHNELLAGFSNFQVTRLNPSVIMVERKNVHQPPNQTRARDVKTVPLSLLFSSTECRLSLT